MHDEVEQVKPFDYEISEEWLRKTDEPEVRAVSAAKVDKIGGWHVAVWAMEFVRSDPLEAELRQRIARALQAVTGVTSAEEQDRELWFVTGTPSGRALVEAAARVVDALADQTRVYIQELLSGQRSAPRGYSTGELGANFIPCPLVTSTIKDG